MILWKLDLQLPVKSVPITTKVVSLNPTHCNVYLIKLVGDRSLVHRFSQSRKLTSQNNLNIVESGVEHHNQEFYTTIQYNQEFYTIIQYSQEFYTIIQYNQEFYTTIQYKLGILHSHII